ncbi:MULTISPECIES: hypothetical protein [Clostridium]|uniref:DUF4083 domain-containing protein n=1 Tax=Clostridium saccharoperbutylacetonicum N1-4(HMT) TaxID=931276 RepID=M1MMI2_9CLOT|nr:MULTISPECIES: hypothetical protein [Clostridium]AGF55951.1 hypothetical protein Cspa_c21860 [Clostridium saccharoperbutylacetonicum N1-4(HMT)]AQR94693.1 hypothetical protein CLSAP_20070 [Clostridium saccharoperbutylacetonicum]NRT63310.1 hypothetical protein [Clostridium saccharoperbutylacetonicum]NSB26672.1 hypothetical protein [Clostridium saccharoperbutylacetonicum]NSB30534.1 hypothetical protein [Clostridium saccharoperbutylacetonicum]
MEIKFMTLLMNWINFGLIILIIIGIYKGVKGLKSFINRNKQMNEKIDAILEELEKKK